MNRRLRHDDLDGEVAEDAHQPLVELFGLHLTVLEVSVFEVPNDRRLLLFDERAVSLVFVSVHDQANFFHPFEVVAFDQRVPVVAVRVS